MLDLECFKWVELDSPAGFFDNKENDIIGEINKMIDFYKEATYMDKPYIDFFAMEYFKMYNFKKRMRHMTYYPYY